MKLVKGLIDYSVKPDNTILLFTGNAFIKKNGALVMGRGAAKQVRDLYPGIDKDFGTEIRKSADPWNYGVVLLPCNIGVFQVKKDWFDKADLNIIKRSVKKLKWMAMYSAVHDIHMNFPGIGNGKLNREDVLPLLQDLPDNVVIYEAET